jgi:hypothetical protein
MFGYSQTVGYINNRNNYRYSNYHRLDLVANFHWKYEQGENIFSINVYNTYAHNNPFVVIPMEGKLRQVCIFPIIPTLSWQYKF